MNNQTPRAPGIRFSGPAIDATAVTRDTPRVTHQAQPNALTLTIRLKGEEHPGKLPLMPRRMLLIMADHEAAGSDWVVRNSILAAVIDFCWPDKDFGAGHWRRDYGGDLVEYGEVVLDHLMVDMGLELEHISFEGRRLLGVISTSMISQVDLDEAREDFTDGRQESSDEATDDTRIEEPEEGWPVSPAEPTT